MKVKLHSDALRPQGLQPTRLLCPWDFPGKSTGVGCHRLILNMLLLHNKASPSLRLEQYPLIPGGSRTGPRLADLTVPPSSLPDPGLVVLHYPAV